MHVQYLADFCYNIYILAYNTHAVNFNYVIIILIL